MSEGTWVLAITALVATFIGLLAVMLIGYPLYLMFSAMLHADWTWAKAGAIALGSLTCVVPAVLAFTKWGRRIV